MNVLYIFLGWSYNQTYVNNAHEGTKRDKNK